MLTKTDCLSDKWNPQSSAIDLDNPHLRDAVFYGMQLFARECLIDYLMNAEGFPKTLAEFVAEYHLQSINQK